MRVLLVDDEEDFATALRDRLAKRGFVAEAVFDGEAAIERVRSCRFDVMVVDLRMPGMGGLATLRAARSLDPHLQVVVLTGHGTVASGIESMHIGAADFLQKPADIEHLSTAIRAAADRTREARVLAGRQGGRT